LRNLGRGNIILSLAGLIPGYWFAVIFIDIIGRKRLQTGGFVILTLIFATLGFGLHTISNSGLVVLFCLANFFCGFGPNSTTFVIPGEVFPTRYRSTAHGISAASGKIGAIISQALIGPLRDKGGPNQFLNHVMQIFALFMYLIPVNLFNAQVPWHFHYLITSGNKAHKS
jgi:MFS transporter, PHS family, inorganic phosphate transporter